MDNQTNSDSSPHVDPEVHRVEVHAVGSKADSGENANNSGNRANYSSGGSRGVHTVFSTNFGNTGGSKRRIPLLQFILAIMTLAAILAGLVVLFIVALPLMVFIAAVMLIGSIIGALTRK